MPARYAVMRVVPRLEFAVFSGKNRRHDFRGQPSCKSSWRRFLVPAGHAPCHISIRGVGTIVRRTSAAGPASIHSGSTVGTCDQPRAALGPGIHAKSTSAIDPGAGRRRAANGRRPVSRLPRRGSVVDRSLRQGSACHQQRPDLASLFRTPDETGAFKLVRENHDATPNVVLPPGGYVVHVSLGLVSVLRPVTSNRIPAQSRSCCRRAACRSRVESAHR